MKYKTEEYTLLDSGYYEMSDIEDIRSREEKLVKCREKHICHDCQRVIRVGQYAVRETGFVDGFPFSEYTCTDCIDRWLDQKARMEAEDESV